MKITVYGVELNDWVKKEKGSLWYRSSNSDMPTIVIDKPYQSAYMTHPRRVIFYDGLSCLQDLYQQYVGDKKLTVIEIKDHVDKFLLKMAALSAFS